MVEVDKLKLGFFFRPRHSLVDVKLLTDVRCQHCELGPHDAVQSAAEIQCGLNGGIDHKAHSCAHGLINN